MKHVTPDQWAYVIVPFLVYGGIVAYLAVLGWDAGMRANLHRNPLVIFFKMISAGMERATGYPGWAMAGALSGLWSLGTAAVGLYWDVAWHIDFGRDKQLFTPPHTMIVIGLAGIIYTACIAVVFATLYIMSLVGLLINLISDLTYTWVDPRIDFETREV